MRFASASALFRAITSLALVENNGTTPANSTNSTNEFPVTPNITVELSPFGTENIPTNLSGNVYYDLTLWNELIISLSTTYWEKILNSTDPEAQQQPSDDHVSEGIQFKRLNVTSDYAKAVQKCLLRGRFVFGPRNSKDVVLMRTDGVDPFWVALDRIPNSENEYIYANGDQVPKLLPNKDDLLTRVEVLSSAKTETEEEVGSGDGTTEASTEIVNCYAFAPDTLTYTVTDCGAERHVYCAKESDVEEREAQQRELAYETTQFLESVDKMGKAYTDVINAISAAWEEATEVEICSDSIKIELLQFQNITSQDGKKSLGLLRMSETIKSNLEILFDLMRQLHSTPKSDWAKTTQGFCLPALHELPFNLSIPSFNFTYPVCNHTNVTTVTYSNWWSFTLTDLILTMCSVLLAWIAIINCGLSLKQRLRPKKPRPLRRQSQEMRINERATINDTRSISRTASVYFSPMVQQRQISPASSSSNSTMGDYAAQTYYDTY
jgi:hypothetical protein